MRKELLDEIKNYLFYSLYEGKKGILKSYKEVDIYEHQDYENLYEGGNYVYDEELNKLYLCEIEWED